MQSTVCISKEHFLLEFSSVTSLVKSAAKRLQIDSLKASATLLKKEEQISIQIKQSEFREQG